MNYKKGLSRFATEGLQESCKQRGAGPPWPRSR